MQKVFFSSTTFAFHPSTIYRKPRSTSRYFHRFSVSMEPILSKIRLPCDSDDDSLVSTPSLHSLSSTSYSLLYSSAVSDDSGSAVVDVIDLTELTDSKDDDESAFQSVRASARRGIPKFTFVKRCRYSKLKKLPPPSRRTHTFLVFQRT